MNFSQKKNTIKRTNDLIRQVNVKVKYYSLVKYLKNMEEIMAKTFGKAVWFDILITDFEAASSFYESFLGWKFVMIFEGYYMIQAGEETIGGLKTAKDKNSSQNAPVIYFDVESLNKSKELAVELGTELIGDVVDLGGDGFFQHFKDMDNNVLALWSEKL